MARDREPAGASRRQFLKAAAGVGASLAAPPARADAPPADAASPPSGAAGFLAPEERAQLARLSDVVIPEASQRGAVEYVEQLLTAFDHDPPRIHAGGPFSGRHPYPTGDGRPSDRRPENDFARFLPLNRVQERAWRIRLFGSESEGAIEGAPPVAGLRNVVRGGARDAVRLAKDGRKAEDVWSELPEPFREEFAALVIEGCFGDPVYGGNRGGAGWRAVHFEGDSLPLGYTPWDEKAGEPRERPDAPVSTLEGVGPDPLGLFSKIVAWGLGFLSRRIGS